MKRKLIASFMFDCGTAINAAYIPTASFYWNIENATQGKPFQLVVAYAWQDFVVNYEYKTIMEYLKKYSLVELAKGEISERIGNYNGKYCIDIGNEFYMSDKGKCILASNTEKQVENWIKKGEL